MNSSLGISSFGVRHYVCLPTGLASAYRECLPLGRLHQAFPAAARDYFFASAPRTFAAAVLVNALPFERETNPRQSLAVCRGLLANSGNVLILFPEGSRSRTGQLAEFRPGVGMMLAGCATPVLPCYIDGANAALPKEAWCPDRERFRSPSANQ